MPKWLAILNLWIASSEKFRNKNPFSLHDFFISQIIECKIATLLNSIKYVTNN